jgi:hypothetical protein
MFASLTSFSCWPHESVDQPTAGPAPRSPSALAVNNGDRRYRLIVGSLISSIADRRLIATFPRRSPVCLFRGTNHSHREMTTDISARIRKNMQSGRHYWSSAGSEQQRDHRSVCRPSWRWRRLRRGWPKTSGQPGRSARSRHQRPPRPRAPSPRPPSQAITPPAPHTAAPLEPQAQPKRLGSV